jgi:hypothetical protein
MGFFLPQQNKIVPKSLSCYENYFVEMRNPNGMPIKTKKIDYVL